MRVLVRISVPATAWLVAACVALSPTGVPAQATAAEEVLPVTLAEDLLDDAMRQELSGTSGLPLRRSRSGRVALVVYERDTEAILVITPDLEFDVRDFFWKGEDHLVYFSNEKWSPVFGGITTLDGSDRRRAGESSRPGGRDHVDFEGSGFGLFCIPP